MASSFCWVQVLFVEFCWFFICIFVVFGSIHIQNLQESQGWRELRLYARSFSLYFVMVLGLYILVFGPRSVNPSVRPRQYTPVAVRASASWLFVLHGAMFSKASLRGPNVKPRGGGGG